MPVKKLWLNLPVKDVKKSKHFFTQLGFATDSEYGNTDHSCPVVIGGVQIMLFSEEKFQGFTSFPMTNTNESSEVLISLDAESRAEVDEYAVKVESLGGTIFSQPAEHDGWMYGFGFVDLDGNPNSNPDQNPNHNIDSDPNPFPNPNLKPINLLGPNPDPNPRTRTRTRTITLTLTLTLTLTPTLILTLIIIY